mmetsp:Transcript_29934/g.71912  ORF Transcript_29934/g.71912 Transcript_29934/m.71912 type:complete len:103 (+) Transcript_29934:2308-2616(+)
MITEHQRKERQERFPLAKSLAQSLKETLGTSTWTQQIVANGSSLKMSLEEDQNCASMLTREHLLHHSQFSLFFGDNGSSPLDNDYNNSASLKSNTWTMWLDM